MIFKRPKPDKPKDRPCPGCGGRKRVVVSKRKGITVMKACPLCKGSGKA